MNFDNLCIELFESRSIYDQFCRVITHQVFQSLSDNVTGDILFDSNGIITDPVKRTINKQVNDNIHTNEIYKNNFRKFPLKVHVRIMKPESSLLSNAVHIDGKFEYHEKVLSILFINVHMNKPLSYYTISKKRNGNYIIGKIYEPIYHELFQVVRHELQHYKQQIEDNNLKAPKFKSLFDYYSNAHEVEAYIKNCFRDVVKKNYETLLDAITELVDMFAFRIEQNGEMNYSDAKERLLAIYKETVNKMYPNLKTIKKGF